MDEKQNLHENLEAQVQENKEKDKCLHDYEKKTKVLRLNLKTSNVQNDDQQLQLVQMKTTIQIHVESIAELEAKEERYVHRQERHKNQLEKKDTERRELQAEINVEKEQMERLTLQIHDWLQEQDTFFHTYQQEVHEKENFQLQIHAQLQQEKVAVDELVTTLQSRVSAHVSVLHSIYGKLSTLGKGTVKATYSSTRNNQHPDVPETLSILGTFQPPR